MFITINDDALLRVKIFLLKFNTFAIRRIKY